MVTANIAAGRNRTIDYNAGQACDVVIKVSTCIRTAWNRVRNMFATVLTTITTIWRQGFNKAIVQNMFKHVASENSPLVLILQSYFQISTVKHID